MSSLYCKRLIVFTLAILAMLNVSCVAHTPAVVLLESEPMVVDQMIDAPVSTVNVDIYEQASGADAGERDESLVVAKPLTLSSPFLRGVRMDDLARLQALAKRQMVSHWHVVGERSSLVRQRILASLQDMGAPEDLQIIPIVESAYRPYAMSRTGAMGLWQLMPGTARSLGVLKTSSEDGRRHIEASTHAAATYLMTQYERFGNWPMAFAAYNMGPNGLARRLEKTPWTLEDGLATMPVPYETRSYVERIIGLTVLLNLHVLSFPEEIQTTEVTLSAPVDIQRLEQALGLPDAYLFHLNPKLHYSQYLSEPIALHVPEELAEEIIALHRQQRPQYIHVRIRSGDSLWSLAKEYQTSVQHIQHLNPKMGTTLSIGQLVLLPAHGFSRASATLNPLLSQGNRVRYKVRQGDSLWSISRRFGTTTDAIVRTNQLSNQMTIRPGDTLWILARIRPS